MFIAKREGYGGSWDYFQDNIDDSPKWTRDKSKAGVFQTMEDAMKHSNPTGLYEIILEEI
jgi:hypothetical protein